MATIKDNLFQYIQDHCYISLSTGALDLSLPTKLMQDYLYELKQEGRVYSAGYGVYSAIPKTFSLAESNRVNTIKQIVKKAFPFVEFSVWDTQQLQSLFQHTQPRHISFLEVEKDAIQSVYETLHKQYRDSLIERRSSIFIEQFNSSRDPVIIRALPSRSPVICHIPSLEKILVDMYRDLPSLQYIAEEDYWLIWKELLASYRINLGTVHSYSVRKKCFHHMEAKLSVIAKGFGIDICRIFTSGGK